MLGGGGSGEEILSASISSYVNEGNNTFLKEFCED